MNRIEASFQPLFGLPCWNAKPSYGSFMTMEFGEPHLEIREPSAPKPDASEVVRKLLTRRHVVVHGEWHLWIYCCKWQVLAGKKRRGHSALLSSSKQPIRRAAADLDGQSLVSVVVDPSKGTSVFAFDLGSRLETTPYNDSIQWYLYEPSGFVLSYRADGRISYQPGDTPPNKERWEPLASV